MTDSSLIHHKPSQKEFEIEKANNEEGLTTSIMRFVSKI